MATNATTEEDKKVTAEDLKNDLAAAEVEVAKVTDETAEDEASDDETEDNSAEDGQTGDQTTDEAEAPSFVKQVPSISGDTEEEYRKNLETAYQQSTAEALRLKSLADEANSKTDEGEEIDLSDPLRLYAKQKMDEDISKAFADFSKEYPQVSEVSEYNKFTNEVAALSSTIMTSQRRLASPEELYSKAAIILGWTKESIEDDKDKLSMALKNNAASSKTTSGTAKPTTKSKVTAAMIEMNQKMYPDKTEDEIRKELEPYVK